MKQYFNQGVVVPVTNFPLNINSEKGRSFLAPVNKDIQPLYYPSDTNYSSPPMSGGGAISSNATHGPLIAPDSLTYYGSHTFGIPLHHQAHHQPHMNYSSTLLGNSQPNSGNFSDHQQAANSLFMRYVKSKIVKKIKTDQIPQTVADKYIDIYKELIDKEAQRKKEEQEFLKRQRGFGVTVVNGVGYQNQS